MLEEIAENASAGYISSWDIAKAFDSVPRYAIEIYLDRIGVPASFGKWLLAMDMDDGVFINSPVWREKNRVFSTKIGIPPGDVCSLDIGIRCVSLYFGN